MGTNNVKKAKERFDSELHTKEYKKIHNNSDQLKELVELMKLKPNNRYLDLGTGNGYIAFELNKNEPKAVIFGLDIALGSIEKNRVIVKENNLDNISFTCYDGKEYPYTNLYFDGCVTRYAFHHFPEAKKSIKEINRVIKQGGFFLYSDPLTFPEDNGFVDRFQNLKDDGHNHFYEELKLVDLIESLGFIKEKQFYSEIRYPRDYDSRYKDLISKTNEEILQKYKIEVIGSEVYITVKVMNILFRKVNICN
ncbi:MAG: class I SAM-dependent methyltransferase [Spirochaetaceae bacterium]